MYWPGLDGWPPPGWVWIAAAVLTVFMPLVIVVFGTVGIVAYVIFVAVCLVIGQNTRLKKIGAEDFWKTRPKDE